MPDKDSSKKIEELEKTAEENAKTVANQANTIAKLENEIKKVSDPNSEPRIIQKGKQAHPKYRRNKEKIPATILVTEKK